jgi:hypothetical protein
MLNALQAYRHSRFAAVLLGGLVLFSQSIEAQVSSSDTSAWRCSADGFGYRIEEGDGQLRISGIRAGRIEATLPVKQKKSGKVSIMGQWQAGFNGGFIEITGMTPDRITAFLLVPQNGAGPGACRTRTLAAITIMSAQNGQPAGCGHLDITFDRQNMSVEEAAMQIQQADLQAQAEVEAPNGSQGGGDPNSGLVGTWVSEDSGSAHYTRIEITLRPDGTYTKTLRARTPGWGGGGTGVGGLGGTQEGRWTASGMVVQLSGDGNWPASSHNLSSFTRVQ